MFRNCHAEHDLRFSGPTPICLDKNDRSTMQRIAFLFCFATTTFITSQAPSQDFDGMIRDTGGLTGKPAVIQPTRGAAVSGDLTAIRFTPGSQSDVQRIEIDARGRSRKFKPDQIKLLRIGNRPMQLRRHYPTGSTVLIDLAEANAVIDARMVDLRRERRPLFTKTEFDNATGESIAFIQEATAALNTASRLGVSEGEHVIFVTDFPPAQRRGLIRTLDRFIPKLREIFGFRPDDWVLPGKPIVAVFARREHLGEFQSGVVGNQNYGTIRAFFHIIQRHPIVTVQDDRSARHLVWQAAWGLSGAFAHYSHSDVVLPAWIRVGLQQHCSDVLVDRLSNHAGERKRVLAELASGSLNGILEADNLPLDRQLVCKLIVAHLYSINPAAFGQMVSQLKLGKTTEEALMTCFGMTPSQFATSFGRSLGLPRLTK